MNGNSKDKNRTTSSETITKKNWFQIMISKDWFLFVLAIVVFVIILAAYMLKFAASSISSDPANWGQFGDYVGGLMNPLLSLIVLWTVIKTLRLNSKAVKHASDALVESEKGRIAEDLRIKRQNTFELNLAFQSQDMMHARLTASRLLKKNTGKTYDLNILMKNLGEDYFYIGRVLVSFRQLSVLKTCNLIDEELAKELFDNIYIHFKPYFEKIQNDTTKGFDGLLGDIKTLEDWMPENY